MSSDGVTGKQAVSHAMSLSQAAVKADQSGQTAEAILLYSDAINHITLGLSLGMGRQLEPVRRTYNDRVVAMGGAVPALHPPEEVLAPVLAFRCPTNS